MLLNVDSVNLTSYVNNILLMLAVSVLTCFDKQKIYLKNYRLTDSQKLYTHHHYPYPVIIVCKTSASKHKTYKIIYFKLKRKTKLRILKKSKI